MWNPPGTLLFRVDSGQRTPSDCFLRCLALAQAWQDGGAQAVFVTATGDPVIEARLVAEDIEVEHVAAASGSLDDARATLNLARAWDAAWIVIDGPVFGGAYQRAIKEGGRRLLVVDDDGCADHYWADLVLNPNLGAAAELYSRRAPAAQLLLGPRYALLRREYLRWRQWERRTRAVAKNVLVTLTGEQSATATIRIIQALARLDVAGLEAVIVTPSGVPGYTDMQAAALRAPLRVRLRPNITAMPGLIAWADVAISGGVPPYEWLLLGLPTLFVVLASGQRAAANRLAALGTGVILSSAHGLGAPGIGKRLEQVLTSWEDREAMTRNCRQLVDGQGADRVRMRLRGDLVRLRGTTAADCDLLWQLSNDPEVRANAFSQSPITWDEHVRWLTTRLSDPRAYMFIGVDRADVVIGRVRFEITGSAAQITIAVTKEHRGQGYGRQMVEQGIAYMLRHTWITEVQALVKPANKISSRLFESLGFRCLGTHRVAQEEALQYVLSRADVVRAGMQHTAQE